MYVDKSRVLDNDNSIVDDVYETIEFSDSSQHIYTEPFKIHSNYGSLKKIGSKTATKQTNSSNAAVNKRLLGSTTSKKGVKKSSRVRNLQKHPALKDGVSKAPESENDSGRDETDGTKVQLRVKPSTRVEMTPSSRQIASKQVNTLVSVGLMELITVHSNRLN